MRFHYVCCLQVNPCKHPIVILKDVGHKELVAILQFMYQGEVNVRQEELSAFLKTAEMLQIKGLTGDDSPSMVGTLLSLLVIRCHHNIVMCRGGG
jgi:hypothetical protein